MNWKDTPIFVNQFCNLDRGFRGLIDWLQRAGMTNITVIDNASTWPPLLDYYKAMKSVNLLRQSENLGHEAFWKLGYHHHQTERFIVTDPDVIPDAGCPMDLVLKMYQVADRYPNAKVGPGIRIDNIPDHYHLKDLMIRSECGYWSEGSRMPEGDCFRAQLDTTFSLYQPGASKWDGVHIRLDFPYVVEHHPWYDDSSKSNEERDYYYSHAIPGMSHSG
jgi:hypothetical protein